MALRILSGVVRPEWEKRAGGTATITFNPHTVSGDVVQVSEDDRQSTGPDAPFASEPHKIVSLREIRYGHADDDTHGAIGMESMRYRVDDEFTTEDDRHGLVVKWEAQSLTIEDGLNPREGLERNIDERNSAHVGEHSYMIVGDTEEEWEEEVPPEGGFGEDV